MNSRLSSLQIVILAALALCVCCLFGCIGIIVITSLPNDSSMSTEIGPTIPIVFATYPPTYTTTPAVTKTPVATNTRVIDFVPVTNPSPSSNAKGTVVPQPVLVPPRTPTVASNPYQVVIPTPTAPVMTYPIAFTSTFKIITYNVTGKNSTDISKSLQANAIADPHEPGSDYYAMTKWLVQSNWTVKTTARGCEVGGGDVSVAITITMPLLAPTTGVPADVVKQFNTFAQNTIVHESGHAERALQGGRELQRALGNFAPISDCTGMQSQLNNLFRRSVDAIDSSNTEYDASNQHGRTQGAVYP
jgi:predicted secreted Zn-dependent protease